MDHLISDRQMTELYGLIPIRGVERAIIEVAGDKYDAATDSFTPCIEQQLALRERYTSDMEKFHARGGY